MILKSLHQVTANHRLYSLLRLDCSGYDRGIIVTTAAQPKQVLNQSRPLIFGFLAILGGILFYFLGYGPLTKIVQARDWIAVPTQVETSTLSEGIVRTKDGIHKIYKVNIQYSYQYHGKWYLGNQYNFNNFYSSDYNSLNSALVDYPIGKKMVCYVNPANPNESVIHKELDWYLLPGVMPLILLCIGIGGLCIRAKSPQIDNSPKIHHRAFQIGTYQHDDSFSTGQRRSTQKRNTIAVNQATHHEHYKNQSPN